MPSFDDVDVIEGQGSVGVEIEAQLGAPPPMVIVPCGGGGLSGGIALALPESQILVVEPEGWDDMGRSLALGRIVPVEEPAPPTRCDALQTKLVSPLTFGALRERRRARRWRSARRRSRRRWSSPSASCASSPSRAARWRWRR